MLDLFTFLKPKNELEGSNQSNNSMPFVPDSMWVKCPACNNMLLASDLKENLSVCSKCNHHFRMTARERIKIVADKGTFVEMDKDMESTDILNFPNYKEKLRIAKEKSNEKENVITGTSSFSASCKSFPLCSLYFCSSDVIRLYDGFYGYCYR